MFSQYNNLTNYPEYSALYHRSKNFVTAFGLLSSEKIFIASCADGPTLVVANDYMSAQNYVNQLTELGKTVVYLPYRDELLLHRKSISNSYVFSLSSALYNICRGAQVIVACIDSLYQPLPNYSEFSSQIIRISPQSPCDTVQLGRQLIQMGYVRTDMAVSVGEYCLRGDIIDVFLPTYDKPVRIACDFDVVESIREIDENFLSTADLPFVEIYPLAFCVKQQMLDNAQAQADKQRFDGSARARINTILQEISTSQFSPWLSVFGATSNLTEYLPDNTQIFWEEPKLLQTKVDSIVKDLSLRIGDLQKIGEILPSHANILKPQNELFESYCNFPQTALQQLNYGGSFFQPSQIISFTSAPLYNYLYNPKQLFTDYTGWLNNGYKVLFCCGNEDNIARAKTQLFQLCNFTQPPANTPYGSIKGVILPISYEKGFVSHTSKLVVVGTKDLGNKTAPKVAKTKKQAFMSIKAGDYVVHDIHGIGLCQGIVQLSGSWGMKDFILVTYKGNDKLYVPVEYSNTLSHFSGSEKAPTLSTIGGADFEKVKQKVKENIKQMSIDLLKLYAQRENKRGFVYQMDTYLLKQFEQTFPYAETPDQLTSLSEIYDDLSKNKIMDRLLVGDVGYGKTEVALRAAFVAIANSKQVAFLAPTTILSEQHYQTALARMAPLGIKVACLNRFRQEIQQKQILQKVKNGEIDLLIGTHRLLSSDVNFANLSMLILDEEQRFGVEHKEKIKQLKTNIDVLTLSATPIPRTLYMALTGIRDISVINTAPKKRLAVETFVVEESDSLLREAILREINRDGQVFLVYNRVDSIDYFAETIRNLIPEAKIIVGHGQMDSQMLENNIFAFAKGEYNVLISTTIIENGIDMPNANTLIVYDADKLGLSQLYQLRGRVGRSDRLAYTYFVYRKHKVLSQVAFDRLSAITEYSELGSGFKIAMRDLEIRGAGNILGREQHGNIQKVGYDMYTRLLKEAVAELKGNLVEETATCQVEIDFDAYAPDWYIASAEYRMDFYQKASGITTEEEVVSLRVELTDIYGTPPQPVDNLLCIVLLKVLAGKVGITSVTIKQNKAELTFINKSQLMRKSVFDAISQYDNHVKILTTTPTVILTDKDKASLLKLVANFCRKIKENSNS